jgi:hypothetical protein
MSIITILIVAVVVIVIGSIVYNYACNKENDNLPVKHIPTNGLTGPSYPISEEEFRKMEEYKAKDSTGATEETESKPVVKKTKPKTTKKTTMTKKSSTAKKSTKSSK